MLVLLTHEVEALHEIKHYIERSIFVPITVKSLLRGTGFNESRFREGFKQLFTHNALRYHKIIAMEYAYALLKDGIPAKTVAIILGYKTQSYFNYSFRLIFGIPPSNISRDNDAAILHFLQVKHLGKINTTK